MLNKIFSFLGFNSTDSLIGLSHLNEDAINKENKPVRQTSQKDVKISDLMRGC